MIKEAFSTLLKRTPQGKFDLGQCKSLTIKCLSELGWFNNKLYESEGIAQKGTEHWKLVRDQKNLAGVSSLIQVESMSNEKKSFLQDCGWRHSYMDKVFESNGIDKMLKNKEIDFLFITHEHHDHFLGAPCALKHYPEIPLYVPETFTEKAYKYLLQEKVDTTAEPNLFKHKGPIYKIPQDNMIQLAGLSGVASVTFDVVLKGGIRGESAIFVNVADKGLVILTGCCHKGILEMINFAKHNIVGGDKVYGIYGGLHLAPYGYLLENSKGVIEQLAKYNIPKVAANHCTGIDGIKAIGEAGINLMKGKKEGHITEGDIITF